MSGALLSPGAGASPHTPGGAERRVAVCVEMIFTERPFLERLAAVAAAGGVGIEFWSWQGKDIAGIAEECTRLRLTVAIMGIGQMESLSAPDERPAFLAALRAALSVARRLGCRTLLTTTEAFGSGGLVAPTGRPAEPERRLESIAAGLRAATPLLEDAGVTLAVEVLNGTEYPVHSLNSSQDGLAVVETVDSPAVTLLYDVYHAVINGDDYMAFARTHAGRIGHVHLADAPGRHQLGTGTVDMTGFVAALVAGGYGGWLGLEYIPLGAAAASVGASLNIMTGANWG